jgi:methylated-DNA-[protein]-cysteine S-methyltransferase
MNENTFIYKGPFGNIGCIFDEDGFLIKIVLLSKDYKSAKNHPFFKELDLYFEGDRKFFKQRFKIVGGTDFERNVWNALKYIPYGEVRTYKWIAEKIGKQNSSRAVGQALKKNPLPIIIPCHRVICSNGFIGGFLWGIEIKRFLLEHEKSNF